MKRAGSGSGPSGHDLHGAVESDAATLAQIIQEVAAARQTERGTRTDDRRSDTAMEDRKKTGYF